MSVYLCQVNFEGSHYPDHDPFQKFFKDLCWECPGNVLAEFGVCSRLGRLSLLPYMGWQVSISFLAE